MYLILRIQSMFLCGLKYFLKPHRNIESCEILKRAFLTKY